MGELAGLLVTQGVQAGTSAANAYSQAQAMRGQQQYANAMTNVNSGWNALQQRQILDQGQIAGSRARLAGNQLAATQAAIFARNGVNPSVGSAGVVQQEARLMGELERLQIQQSAYNQALGLRAENMSAISQNRMRQMAVREGINSVYANAAQGAASSTLHGLQMYNRYKGLQTPATPKAIDGTLNYVPRDLMAPNQPYDPDLLERPVRNV